jgi:hypothetical protein
VDFPFHIQESDIALLGSWFVRLLRLYGRVHILVLSWSNNCYLGFQSAVLVAIRAASFQSVTK